MRIIDEEGNEISLDEVDTDLGTLKKDYVFKKHHDGVSAQSEQGHTQYTVKYMDGTVHTFDHLPEKENYLSDKDVIDEREEYVIDKPYAPAVEPWDENEEVLRYVLYTQDQLDAIQANKDALERADAEKREQQQQLQEIQWSIDDTMLVLADLIGGIW